MNSDGSISICSVNVRGLADYKKRKDMFMWLRRQKANIFCLQDTHCDQKKKDMWQNEWGGTCLFSGKSSNSRGVAILFNNNFQFEINEVREDGDGNFLGLNMTVHSYQITLISLYGPSRDNPEFYKKTITETIQYLDTGNIILCGDWNLVQHQLLDTYGYLHENNLHARQEVQNLTQLFDMIDPWRLTNPLKKQFTWRNDNKTKFGRLDFFIISANMYQYVTEINILPGYRTDHSLIIMKLKLINIEKGRGFWKFNTSLLENTHYINKVKSTIKSAVQKYSNTATENQTNVDDTLMWEMIKMEIRKMTITFSSELKKKLNSKEKFIETNIAILEKGLHLARPEVKELYDRYKTDLQNIREIFLKGAIIRSRARWLEEGEKATKYFCGLEKKNFVDKSITKVILENNTTVEEQKDILSQLQLYYTNLYTSTTKNINTDNVQQYITKQKLLKISEEDQQQLNADFTEEEIKKTIKNMANNKTPGTDGFPIEFYKFFWTDISKYLISSIMCSFNSSSLSINQRRGIITCLPKGNKDRTRLKNWRPITLLNSDYKIISNVLANRLKQFLPNIINQDQKGFIKGRFIGENTRLIYDIISKLDSSQTNGLLMLLDFEKAFDSVEWSFIEYTLLNFNLGNTFLKWFTILYKDSESCVINNGTYSEFFKLGRGCRQGDPLSPYIFTLVAEVLANSIRQNDKIKGISIDKNSYVIGQYADDTFLLLDGSKTSVQEVMKCLDTFATFSGLKINKDKCETVWLGQKKGSTEQILPELKCVVEFKVLGIIFPSDLQKIIQINLHNTITNIDKLLMSYGRRGLSIIGRVTVIKTLAVSKLIHVLSITENPSSNFINEIENKFQNFVWNNKSARIKYTFASKPYEEGGLSLPDLHSLVKSLKLTWVKRSYTLDGSWQTLFSSSLDHPDRIWSLDPVSLKSLARKQNNGFWRDVLNAWSEYVSNTAILNLTTIKRYCIWNSHYINSTNLIKRKSIMVRSGCQYIGDLLTDRNTFYTLGDFQNKFRSLQAPLVSAGWESF